MKKKKLKACEEFTPNILAIEQRACRVEVHAFLEWIETYRPGRAAHVIAYLVFESGDERSETVLYDKEMEDGNRLMAVVWADDALKKLGQQLPGRLIKCAEEQFLVAADEAIRDNHYIPPRNVSDWSYTKLYNALDQAFFAAIANRPNRDPTLSVLADYISRGYRLEKKLKSENLRKLLEKHGIDWRDTKRRWKEHRLPKKRKEIA